MATTKICVHTPAGESYDVRIGRTVLDSLGEHMRAVERLSDCSHVLVVTDANVAPRCLRRAKESLREAGFEADHVIIAPGEGSKSIQCASDLWQAMTARGINRSSAVVALGGGVVGDVAGFAASTYMRGIPVVQVPTTLLAMIDSSVGGKTAVNLPAGKNLVGTFWQPAYVCVSTDVLATLPAAQWASGWAEAVKMALLGDDEFLFWLMDNAPVLAQCAANGDVLGESAALLGEAIARCVCAKADVVAMDALERNGLRQCLNYGHTLGHALEAVAGFGTIPHGLAVALGMRFAAALACKSAGMSEEFAQAQNSLLDAFGATSDSLEAYSAHALVEAMLHDKKNENVTVLSAGSGRTMYGISMILLTDVGEWTQVQLPAKELERALRRDMHAAK